MAKLKIKSGDKVRVITGENKGQSGKVLKVNIAKQTAIIEGINMVSKHKKPSAQNPQGGIEQMEAPIHISNVMLEEGGEAVRVGYKVEDGKKIRYSKKSGKEV